MESTNLVSMLAGIAKIMAENEALKAELDKYKIEPQIVLENPKKSGKKAKVVDPNAPVKIKHASHIATGLRVAAINAIRKEFMENARLAGEW
jgi:hypothetical protein